MPSRWRWFAASLLLAAPAAGATVRQHDVRIEVRSDGTVRETVSLQVALDGEPDLASWSQYPVLLDEHRRLVRLAATATRPDGSTVKLRPRHRDRVGVTGDGVLHASLEAELVELPPLPVGSVLSIEHEVEERPYFPSGVVGLGGEDAVSAVQVEVRSAAPGLRFRLDRAHAGLEVVQEASAVIVRGSLPAFDYDEPASKPPVLRYGWGGAGDWPAVGAWYGQLIAGVPRGGAGVRALAASAAPADVRREEVVRSVLAVARRDVRYVAVAIGIGGYVPASPEVVLGRRWGDCKDKALLLIDLLAARGIEARPALVRGDEETRIDTDFPSPDQFNHLIVAVPAAGLEVPPGAPVAGGWLFLDATQDRGGLEWLHPWLRGTPALVITPGGGELVEIPVAPAVESERLAVSLTLGEDGSGRGDAELTLRGATAWGITLGLERERREDVLAAATRRLSGRLPGARLSEVVVAAAAAGDVPQVALTAKVEWLQLVSATGSERSFVLPGLPGTPSGSTFDPPAERLPLAAGVTEASWRLRLPWEGCTVSAAAAADSPTASFTQQARVDGRLLSVERRTEVAAREARGEELAALQRVAVAEQRALKRRVRLSCGGAP
jgi:hypothetical protein